MLNDRSVLGIHKNDIDTPALLVDLSSMERNITRMANYLKSSSANLRPHAKTHKTPIIAHKQIEAGAKGVTCAKLEEAEVMASSGIKDILIANQIIGEQKIQRLVNLARHSSVIIAVDNAENAENLSRVALEKGLRLKVVIEVNIGMNRCGVEPGEASLLLAKRITQLKGLDLKGIMGYEGHAVFIPDFQKRKEEALKAYDLLLKTKEMIEKSGIEVEIVSTGGTGTYNFAGEYPGVTEIQAGSYALMDGRYKKIGINFECALTLLVTVISKPTKELAIIDAGRKAISDDFGLPQIKDIEGMELFRLSEEHGRIQLKNPSREIRVGDKIELLPSHGCTTINLHDRFYCVRDDRLETVWDILARGKFR